MAMAESPDCLQAHAPLAIEASLATSLLNPQDTGLELSAVTSAGDSVDQQPQLEHGDVPSSLPFLLDVTATQHANHGAGQLVADYLTSLADAAQLDDGGNAVNELNQPPGNQDGVGLDHLISTFLVAHASLDVHEGVFLDEGLGFLVGDVLGLDYSNHPTVDEVTDGVSDPGVPVDDISSDPFPDINLHGMEALVGAHSSLNAGHAGLG